MKREPIDPKSIKYIYDESKYLVRNKETNEIFKLEINQDQWAENPREWDNVCTIISPCNREWDVSDKGHHMDVEEFKRWLTKAEKNDNISWRYIYMYDHSGQTISLTSFGDPWDSGICGIIYVDKKTVLKECGGATKDNWKEKAFEQMKAEIEVYDQFIRGDVYGFRLCEAHQTQHKDLRNKEEWETTEWRQIEACSGFYGDDPNENGLFDEVGIPKYYDIIEEIDDDDEDD